MAPNPFSGHKKHVLAPGRAGTSPGQIRAEDYLAIPVLDDIHPNPLLYQPDSSNRHCPSFALWVILRRAHALGFAAALGADITGGGAIPLLVGSTGLRGVNEYTKNNNSCFYLVLI